MNEYGLSPIEGMLPESIRRVVNNLCPKCGADNMPTLCQMIGKKPKWICPECKYDRTPSLEDYEERW